MQKFIVSCMINAFKHYERPKSILGRTGFYHVLLFIGIILLINILGIQILHAENGLPYRVKIEGVPDSKIRKLLEDLSNTISSKKTPAASLGLLRKRAERDTPQFLKVLKSQGYYAAKVGIEIKADDKPVQVIFKIDPGPPFLLESVHVQVVEENEYQKIRLPAPQAMGFLSGNPAKSKSIVDGENRLISGLKIQGYPFPRIEEQKIIVNHATKSVAVEFKIDPGPIAVFGSTEIKGLESVDEIFIRRKIPWKKGDRFNADLLAVMKNKLILTNLFAMIQVKITERFDEESRLPVIISVKERKHRTIKAGISYKTDEGAGGKISWEHRNFFRHGDRLGSAIVMSEIAYAGEGNFKKPDFLRDDQSLILKFRMAEDQPDAFISRNMSSSLIVERTLFRHIKLGGGFVYRFSQVNQLGIIEGFSLISIPMYFDLDTSNDLLDPTRGSRLTLQLVPFYDLHGSEFGFVKGYTNFSHYIAISKSPDLVLAGRAALGSISGAGRKAIPADIRFYGGGGGSIRGYPFQSVGPLLQKEPIGGRSLMELSIELRLKLTDTIGIVAFADGGSAFSEAYPDFEERLRWGTGLGFRYFTAVGPIRVDIALPLHRREGIDKRFQLYISLGQAF
jgi:translocation and assembly module TamA